MGGRADRASVGASGSDPTGRRSGAARQDASMIKLTVNGAARSFDGDPDMPLLWYLRDDPSGRRPDGPRRQGRAPVIHDAQMMAELANAKPTAKPVLANVSRRGILGGAGALVLALSLRDARADEGQTAEQKAQKFGA